MSDTPHLDALGFASRRSFSPKDLQKPVPTVLRKDAKKKTKAEQERGFREAVWARDRSHSRATGKPLKHSGGNLHVIGEVHHVLSRSTDPEKRYDPTNG